jgi:hypothetical protein
MLKKASIMRKDAKDAETTFLPEYVKNVSNLHFFDQKFNYH